MGMFICANVFQTQCLHVYIMGYMEITIDQNRKNTQNSSRIMQGSLSMCNDGNSLL